MSSTDLIRRPLFPDLAGWTEALPRFFEDRPLAYRAAVATFFGAMILLVAFTFTSYGFSTDEVKGDVRGVRVYQALFGDGVEAAGLTTFSNMNLYGAMPDFLAVVLMELFPPLSVHARHLVSALFGLAGIYYVHRIGAAFFDRWTAVFAPLFLSVNTLWFGYMFFNLKDVPFAALIVAGFYYCMMGLLRDQPSVWIGLGVAVSVGLLSTTKLLGVVILGFCCFVGLAAFLTASAGQRVALDRRLLVRVAWVAVLGLIGCAICLWIFLPQFYVFDLQQKIAFVSKFLNYDGWRGTLLLDGETYKRIGPRHYMLVYLGISIPLFLVALVALSPYFLFRHPHPMALACAVIVVAFVAYQFATQAKVYGGARHFLFLMPFAMILAAYAASCLVQAPGRWVRGGAIAAIVLGLVWSSMSIHRLFPYQYSFYNALVGGLPGADGRFYVDVWRTAATEALRTLEAQAVARGDKIVVRNCGISMSFRLFPNLIRVKDPNDAEYLVSLRGRCPPTAESRWAEAGEITREGVTFATVYRNLSYGR